MKRTFLLCILLLLCLSVFGCAAAEPETRESLVVSAPGEQDVTLTLPLVRRNDATVLLKGYTDGFISGSGRLLTFSTETENPTVALSSLFEDGSLCILAAGEGKTTVTVTAIAETGESATGRINVTVRSARRIAALLVVGLLAVVLLILFGKPNKQKAPAEPEPESEEPNERQQSSERS